MCIWVTGQLVVLRGGEIPQVAIPIKFCTLVALLLRSILDSKTLRPGCSCSSVLKMVPCPAPSHRLTRPRVLVDASLPPAHTCPDPSNAASTCASFPKHLLATTGIYSTPRQSSDGCRRLLIHACERHVHERHAYKRQVLERHIMRGTPMRGTSVRCTPVRHAHRMYGLTGTWEELRISAAS
jgi:hypothetical protein